MRKGFKRASRHFLAATVGFALVLAPAMPLVWAGPPFAEFLDPNPAPGNRFGDTVVALSTGNVVITSPYDDAGGTDAGAVYLFNGATGALISTLLGSSPNDNIGSGTAPLNVQALANGNYVINSPNWDNGAATDAGAVTWASGTTGISGVVGASNSLVGSSANDRIGVFGVAVLTNGNYVVHAWFWRNGAAADAGAITWGSGTTGVTGVVSASNSLVGTSPGDGVSVFAIPLTNGNYVVTSTSWDNGAVTDAGAVTWRSGWASTSGVRSVANSLVGSSAGDSVGVVVPLPDGNYVVESPSWNSGGIADVGAVTWGSGTTGVNGVVSDSNSLVGSSAGDSVGYVTVLTNGNYVVSSQSWRNGAVARAGAVTWINAAAPLVGPVSVSNSLVGSTFDDRVGGIELLTNGNFVVRSIHWTNGVAAKAGAVTWVSGTSGAIGVVGVANSLVGSTTEDRIGLRFVGLTNGNYVVGSPFWDNGSVTDAGAVAWVSGTTGLTGVVTVSNSLVGSSPFDQVGGVAALANGNYVVGSPVWDRGAVANAGAATWGSGTTGVTGAVGIHNSLVGSSVGDGVGNARALTNGNYVVSSPFWGNGGVPEVGAVTWCSGTTATSGSVSASNSLVGSSPGDRVGSGGHALTNGNYVVGSQSWANGGATYAGAVTWMSGVIGTSAVVSATNSLVGSAPGDQVGHEYGNFYPTAVNDNYLVKSRTWSNGSLENAGAVTWASGVGGTVGTLAGRSLVGTTANTDFQRVVLDNVNGTYIANFPAEGGGRVRLGSQADGVPTSASFGPVSSANVTLDSADVSGNVTSDNGVAITARGFVYSATATNGLPAIGGAGVTKILVAGTTGPVSHHVAGLVAGTNYSFRVFATSAAGTSYSATGAFTTLSSRVFVATLGSDGNACSTQKTPCRSLAAAMSQVVIDGEVIVLTPGEYDTAPLLISKGVKITTPSGTVAFIRQPITVNAPGARVALRGLTLKGTGASTAITLTAAEALSIEDTTVDGWGVGLDIANAAPSSVAITKVVFQGNLTGVRDAGPASNRVSTTGSRFEGNGTGLSAAGGTHTVSECSFGANTVAISVSSGVAEISRTELWSNGIGLGVLSGGTARIGRSHVFGNGTGLSAAGGSTLASFGSNVIRGNGTNVDGAVTTVPEQ